MDREKGALEVWLKGEKPVLVGWLTDFAPFDHRLINIEIEVADWEIDSGATVDDVVINHHFLLTTKAVDRDHALTLSEGTGPRSWYGKNVPIGAVHRYFEHGNVDRYTWKVLQLDMDDYEFVFDLPTFEAFEPKPKRSPWTLPIDASPWPTGGAVDTDRLELDRASFKSEYEAVWTIDKAAELRDHAIDAFEYTLTDYSTKITIDGSTSALGALTATQERQVQDYMKKRIEDAMYGRPRRGY